MWGQVGETKETFTFGGIRDETVALIYMLHRLIATPSKLVPKLRQFLKLALSFNTSKDLLEGAVRMSSHVIYHHNVQSEVVLTQLKISCRDKKERMGRSGIVKILSVSLVSTLSSMAP